MEHQRQSMPISSIYVSKSDYPKSPYTWPPAADNGAFAALKSSIKKSGLLTPVFVQKIGSKYRVKQGHYRFQACVELGWKFVPIVEVPGGIKDEDIGAWYFGYDNVDEERGGGLGL